MVGIACLIIWLASMILIWLFLLRFVHFIVGTLFANRDRHVYLSLVRLPQMGSPWPFTGVRGVRPFLAGVLALLFGVLQFLALWVTLSHVGVSHT